jgi:hypothetical protein
LTQGSYQDGGRIFKSELPRIIPSGHTQYFSSNLIFLIFQQAHSAILKERETAEKQIRAREAREKQERERAERSAKKKALVDFNAPDDQEGVMDSLLEALKTGSAFNRDGKRKRPAPRAAGGEFLKIIGPKKIKIIYF